MFWISWFCGLWIFALWFIQNDEITACTIPQAQVLKNDHTIYQIHVENHNISDEDHCKWTVMKRFQDFCSFDTEVRSAVTNDYPDDVAMLPPLPPKYFKILVDHLDETFIEKRRLLLQCYIQRLCKYPLLRRHDYTLKFFQVTGYQWNGGWPPLTDCIIGAIVAR